MNTPEESAFDARLRRLADAASTHPLPPGGLADVRARLAAAAPPAPAPRASRWRPFVGGVVVGILLMLTGWWVGQPAPSAVPSKPVATSALPPAHQAHASRPARVVVQTAAGQQSGEQAPPAVTAQPAPSAAEPSPSSSVAVGARRPQLVSPPVAASAPALSVTDAPPTVVVPVRFPADSGRVTESRVGAGPEGWLAPRWQHAAALDTAVRQELARSAADSAAAQARFTRLRLLLAAESAALSTLQATVDSLKAELPAVPPALTTTSPDTTAAPDWRTLPASRSPWALVGLLETTPSWSTVPAQHPATEQERTQRSLSQSVLVQRQVGQRWLVRAGFGQLSTESQVRRTSERSGSTTQRDSATLTDISVRQTETTVLIVKLDSVPKLEPITNLNDQIIGYDTVGWLLSADTTRTITVNNDTLRTTHHVVTTRTETWREARQQQFRPVYRFWTLPVAVQYQVLRTNRWTLGLNLGAQATLFRGGARPVWNGVEYQLQPVRVADGPYRPVSLSVSAGVEAAYRVTPRLSALLAPTARWWAVPPGKAAAARSQALLPALQLGVSYGF